jgi:uncharacterized protein YwgA
METEKFVLLILDAFGGSAESETRMQKLAFLATKEYDIALDVGFKWHHYGPYSSKLKNRLHDLETKGLIEIDHETRQTSMSDNYTVTKFKLTSKGRIVSNAIKLRDNNAQTNKIRDIVNHYGHQQLSDILSYVYGAYTPEDL